MTLLIVRFAHWLPKLTITLPVPVKGRKVAEWKGR